MRACGRIIRERICVARGATFRMPVLSKHDPHFTDDPFIHSKRHHSHRRICKMSWLRRNPKPWEWPVGRKEAFNFLASQMPSAKVIQRIGLPVNDHGQHRLHRLRQSCLLRSRYLLSRLTNEAAQRGQREKLARREQIAKQLHAIVALRECAARSRAAAARRQLIRHQRQIASVALLPALKLRRGLLNRLDILLVWEAGRISLAHRHGS